MYSFFIFDIDYKKEKNRCFKDKKLNMNKALVLSIVITFVLSEKIMSQTITGFTSLWYNTFSANSGGFGRGIVDNNDLVISGCFMPSAISDQMITKINPMGNTIFQVVRAPGLDHDSYTAVIKLQNGNYGFFGIQNAQGSQYFDGVYTEFDNSGNEVFYNFFSVPGSSSGSDMLILPNGNIVFTGNHGNGQNYIALTDQSFVQLNYQTFNVSVGGWNTAQLGIDEVNNFVYAIGSESNTSTIQIVKYDFSLNYISTFTINNSEPILNYDIKMDGSDLLLCGHKVTGGVRFGTFYKLNSSGILTDSLTAQNNSEFTAIEKYGNQVVLAKSNLSGSNSTLNEIVTYSTTGNIGLTYALNSSSPFVPFDLVLNGDTLYAIGAQGQGYWIGIPAVEKILIDACQISVNTQPSNQMISVGNNIQFIFSTSNPSATYQWQTDLGVGFQNLNGGGQYSGTTNDTLTVSNATMNNNNQPFRCIVSSGSCSDTSTIAVLTVNTNVGLHEKIELLSVYPNPAQSVIYVKADHNLSGLKYKIYNYVGKIALTGTLNAQTSSIDLTHLSDGMYIFSVGDYMDQTFTILKK